MCQMTMIDHIFIGVFCFMGIFTLVLICIESHLSLKAPIRLDPQTQALLRIAMKHREAMEHGEKQAEAEEKPARVDESVFQREREPVGQFLIQHMLDYSRIMRLEQERDEAEEEGK